MTDRELMQEVLEALESLHRTGDTQVFDMCAVPVLIPALRDRLAQPEQEFTTHEEGDEGWSDWVCPDPKSYLMKCCDCGLVHEAQFGVVRYKSETEREDCEMMDDPNLQAVFRMRRSEQWTPEDTAYRPGWLAQPEQEPVAWMHPSWIDPDTRGWASDSFNAIPIEGWVPVFTAPRQWQGLTEEEIKDCEKQAMVNGSLPFEQRFFFARAIEAKLKEKNT